MSRLVLWLSLALGAALLAPPAVAQREYVPPDHPVYRFLLRQSMAGRIQGFPWGMLPLSRHDVAAFLRSLGSGDGAAGLSDVDQGILRDYAVEFSYDLGDSLSRSSSFLPAFRVADVARDDSRKYLYAYTDSLTAFFIDGLGSLERIWSSGDSWGRAGATLGEIGVRFRGTLADKVGFYLQAVNGSLLSGSHDITLLDHRRLANRKYNWDERKFYDLTTGYLRYDAGWFGVTLGREQMLWGAGYGDRAVFSANTVPFDYLRIELDAGVLDQLAHRDLVAERLLPVRACGRHRLVRIGHAQDAGAERIPDIRQYQEFSIGMESKQCLCLFSL